MALLNAVVKIAIFFYNNGQKLIFGLLRGVFLIKHVIGFLGHLKSLRNVILSFNLQIL
jgi:hypothetical protein